MNPKDKEVKHLKPNKTPRNSPVFYSYMIAACRETSNPTPEQVRTRTQKDNQRNKTENSAKAQFEK
jgi:hypothetical protein